jgi:hypothetical protein
MKKNNEISITPVSKGWLVKLPSVEQNLFNDGTFDRLTHMMTKLIKGEADESCTPLVPHDDEQNEKQINKETNCFVFQTFAEVLGFLKYTYGS